MTRFWPLLLLLLAATAAMRQPGSDQRGQGTQCETSLTGRWVGLHQNQTLHPMSSQGVLARPLTGRWVGGLGTPDGAEAELRLAPSGTARWHLLPGGPWTEGEWERQTRIITFTWAGSDTIPWVGHYDVEGNAILFERTVPNSRTAIFHRVFR
ncbi:MAG: hypothetical protein HYT81_02840 [Gemmatimonadetes bacterium]|nr:hypothetical protein [Gemmatimonadota bacterium]